jgi:hypothetical protein
MQKRADASCLLVNIYDNNNNNNNNNKHAYAGQME